MLLARYLNSGTYMGDRDALLHLLNFYANVWDFKCYNAVVRLCLLPWHSGARSVINHTGICGCGTT